MVDSINSSGPISTLLRAQNSTLISINNSQQAAQTQSAKAASLLAAVKAVGPDGNLPRGSLIDILA